MIQLLHPDRACAAPVRHTGYQACLVGQRVRRRLRQVWCGPGLRVMLPDGTQLRIIPGRRGQGVRIMLLAPKRQRSFGRKPNPRLGRPASPATRRLRNRLAADRARHLRRPLAEYVDWYARIAKTSDETARLTVRREARRLLPPGQVRSSLSKGGRPPSSARSAVRQQLEWDSQRARLRAIQAYVAIAIRAGASEATAAKIARQEMSRFQSKASAASMMLSRKSAKPYKSKR